MFDRRLKIFLAIVFLFTLVLMTRAAYIQLAQHESWSAIADKSMTKDTYIETVRGKILDFKGRIIAQDVPCIDAMVDYRAIARDPDEKWVRDVAVSRLTRRLGDEYTKSPKAKRIELAKAETAVVKADIDAMWNTLGHTQGMTPDRLDEVRQDIVRKVEFRSRWIWYRSYELAVKAHENVKPGPWITRWLFDDNKPPELDSFKVVVGDELIPYTIVPALEPETITQLGKFLGKFPGLSLQPSTHRYYPYNEAGCHWIGSLAPVSKDEREKDSNFENKLLRYDYADLIGRSGLEALAEPILRGRRGIVSRKIGSGEILADEKASPGQDVRSSVDIELQQDIQNVFPHCVVTDRETKVSVVRQFHGAAVVIDLATGQVRAMASYPAFDPNKLNENYAALSTNELEKPLFNRATMDVLEPGSTVKPMVGLWGIKNGVLGINEQIQCTGYMMYKGQKMPTGRCWVAQRFAKILAENHMTTVNHPVPSASPLNHDLSFVDALERSCNPWHEEIANRLGIRRLTDGFKAFGLGQPTGIGIAERIGRLPDSYDGPNPLDSLWSAGIGQGQVGATPIQMAGVVATIARGGVWMRPTLLAGEVDPSQLSPAVPSDRPAKIDLGIPPEAIAEAHLGMWNVVHTAAGTGNKLDFPEVGVCGKTGTAQAARFMVPQLDADGRPIPKLDSSGKPVVNKFGRVVPVMIPLELGTETAPNPIAPWYQGSGQSGTDVAHAWYMGFAPRENPKIAFVVLVEYGGSGGVTAAAVAHDVLAACIKHGYLSAER